MLSDAFVRSPVHSYQFQVPMRIWKTPVAVDAGFFARGLNCDSACAIRTMMGASANSRSTIPFTVSGLGGSALRTRTGATRATVDGSAACTSEGATSCGVSMALAMRGQRATTVATMVSSPRATAFRVRAISGGARRSIILTHGPEATSDGREMQYRVICQRKARPALPSERSRRRRAWLREP